MAYYLNGGIGGDTKEKIDAIYDLVTRNAGFEFIGASAFDESTNISFPLYREEEYAIISLIYKGGDYSKSVSITSDNENIQIEEVLPLYKSNGESNITHYLGLFKIKANSGDIVKIKPMLEGTTYVVGSYKATIERFHIIYS